MKAVNKRKKSLLLYVNLFVLSVRRGGRGASDSREALSRETNEDPNERRGVRIVAKGGKKNSSREPFPGARFSVGETFIVPTKLLYLSIGKTKASYLFLFPYSPRHVSFRFSVPFSFFSFLFSFFRARHVLLPSSPLPPDRVAFARNTQPNTRDFHQATPLIRLGRVELLYTEAWWFTLSRFGSTSSPHASNTPSRN